MSQLHPRPIVRPYTSAVLWQNSVLLKNWLVYDPTLPRPPDEPRYIMNNGVVYQGCVSESTAFSGNGFFRYPNKRVYKGLYKKGKRCGPGLWKCVWARVGWAAGHGSIRMAVHRRRRGLPTPGRPPPPTKVTTRIHPYPDSPSPRAWPCWSGQITCAPGGTHLLHAVHSVRTACALEGGYPWE